MDIFSVKAWGVRCYNLSISDLLMDGLIKNDSLDLLYMVIPRASDESVCGKLSHTNSISIRCVNKTAQRQKKHSRYIKGAFVGTI